MLVGKNKRRTAPPPRETTEVARPQEATNEQDVKQYIEGRDYSGASAYIEFLRDELNMPYTKELALWHGYSLFHIGQYSDAIDVYRKLQEEEPNDTVLHLYISSCHFYNRDYELAREEAEKGPQMDFRTRLFFHIAHQTNDEQRLFQAHSQLIGTLENQLSLAAIHYLRSNYDDAIEIYRRILQQNPDFIALNVYIAMCQFKLDEFEESNESVDQYLASNSDSAVGLNLKACDYMRTFSSDIAESQLLQIRKFASATYTFVDSLIKHNLVIFHNGDDGFTELPKLVGALSEARFNLAVLYMRENEVIEAYNLVQSMQPIEVSENILRAGILLAMGQLNSDSAMLEEANSSFSELGEMEVVRDTIPGRQCLATSKFVMGDGEETLRVLQTIESADGGTDEFNYNKAMSLAMLARWAEAERYFLLVKNPRYVKEGFYTSWLCRCYIMNKKYDEAWTLYVEATQTEDVKVLLQIIAYDCYRAGAYYYSMRAYEVLSNYERDPILRDGMVASAIGVFRGILSRKESADKLSEVIATLSNEPDAAQTLQVIQNYIETSGDLDFAGF